MPSLESHLLELKQPYQDLKAQSGGTLESHLLELKQS